MWLMLVFVSVRVDGAVGVLVFMGMAVFRAMVMSMCVGMLITIAVVNVARFTVRMVVSGRMIVLDDDIDLGSGESAAADFAHLETCADVQCRSGLFEQGKGHARVDKGAEQHVAADAGEALQISDSHGNEIVPTHRAASALQPAAPRSKTRNENLRCRV